MGERLWLLRGALRWLESGPIVTGQQVEVLVGHFVAACMYKRAGLAVMRSLYTLISDKYLTPTRLWASCSSCMRPTPPALALASAAVLSTWAWSSKMGFDTKSGASSGLTPPNGDRASVPL
eukprot:6116623-Heterocapsa_arctica.AAC.1